MYYATSDEYNHYIQIIPDGVTTENIALPHRYTCLLA